MHFLSFFNFAFSPWPLYMTGCILSNPVYTGMDMMDDRTLSIYIIYSCLSHDTTVFYGSVATTTPPYFYNAVAIRTRPEFYGSVADFITGIILPVFLSIWYFLDVFIRLSTVLTVIPK